MTFTGKKYYLTDPHPDDVCIEDIAHALAQICRFGGHTRVHYSVGQHSVLSRCAGMIYYPADRLTQMHLLLHDASEAYIGDVVRPLKISQPDYCVLEKHTMGVIYDALNLPLPDTNEEKLIKDVDNQLLLAEARDLIAGGGVGWNIASSKKWDAPIIPCPPESTERAFLAAYAFLKDKLSSNEPASA